MNISVIERRSQFSHFLNHKIGELKHRLAQVLEICTESQQRFNTKQEPREGESRELNYRFAAFSSLVQTLKDILPVLTDQAISWSSLKHVRHMEFIKQSRNAITHDGNPVINMWADGCYYVACDFVRLDQHGKPELVKAPTKDVATICLEFTLDFTSEIRRVTKPLIGLQGLASPLYGSEFFDQAILHPAVPEFARELYRNTTKQAESSDSCPLNETCEVLDSLIATCNAQLAT
jgi:hypothetical protein